MISCVNESTKVHNPRRDPAHAQIFQGAWRAHTAGRSFPESEVCTLLVEWAILVQAISSNASKAVPSSKSGWILSRRRVDRATGRGHNIETNIVVSQEQQVCVHDCFEDLTNCCE